MKRRRGWTAHVGLVLLSMCLMGARLSCDRRIPDIACDPIALTVRAGECIEFQNACDDQQWVDNDSMRVCDGPLGISLRTRRDPRRREVCAATNVEQLDNAHVDYSYSRSSRVGMGLMLVTTTPGLSLTVSATPTLINPGETSQLLAVASGGVPPYTYVWDPSDSLSASDVADPVASPTATTRYTVVVLDSAGAVTSGQVSVTLLTTVTAFADPAVINSGETSQLSLQITGGTPPFSYSWSPAGSLNDALLANPIASPVTTTTYNLVVTDSAGGLYVSSVTVTVNPAAGLSACFTITPANPLVFMPFDLDASCSTGAVSYQWFITPPGEPERTIPPSPSSDPVLNFGSESVGDMLVRLQVSDAAGNTAETSQTIPIAP